ncbi:hypothetical protein [Qingshengfaniella alkalisoli]|uniref:Uncharacterized protein n=1 Tax=Qingshengfaniella alkalisoli TaxID=2599296 RepID=A0A5B8J164_9RHOB|nr:hypothetical protein [Qingshengfaniella alkalisoli]QDY68247.1 hypothetical protein FPZ52_00500 [Qingshengfaniella alkalisoli]
MPKVLLERIVDVSNCEVVPAYEKKIEQLEEQKLLLAGNSKMPPRLPDGFMMSSNTLGDFSQALGKHGGLAISHSSEQY